MKEKIHIAYNSHFTSRKESMTAEERNNNTDVTLTGSRGLGAPETVERCQKSLQNLERKTCSTVSNIFILKTNKQKESYGAELTCLQTKLQVVFSDNENGHGFNKKEESKSNAE